MEQVGVPGPSSDLREVSTSPSFVSDIDYKIIDFNRDSLPRNCENCYLDQFQLFLCYFGQPEKLIRYFQSHGIIKSESDTYCNHCSSVCRLDVIRKAFRCDKSFAVPKKKRQRCNLYVSIFFKMASQLYPPK